VPSAAAGTRNICWRRTHTPGVWSGVLPGIGRCQHHAGPQTVRFQEG
jgi:hypothetical protein